MEKIKKKHMEITTYFFFFTKFLLKDKFEQVVFFPYFAISHKWNLLEVSKNDTYSALLEYSHERKILIFFLNRMFDKMFK